MKKESIRWIGIVVAITLLGSVLAYQTGISSAQVSPSTVHTINQWGGINDCNYLIFTDGTTTYAKNCETGAIDYSGTNSASVIQSAIDASNGGLIFITKGTYTISTGLTITDAGTKIEGAGMKNTILQGAAGVTVLTLGTTNADILGVTIQDIQLNTGAVGINKLGVYELFIEDVWIEDMTSTGLILSGEGATTTSNAYISNSVFNDNRDAIEARDGFAAVTIVNTLNTASDRYGIFWNTTGNQLKVLGGDIANSGTAGIFLPSGNTIRNLSVNGVNFDGINSGATGITVNGTLVGYNIIGSYFRVASAGGNALYLPGATNGVIAGNVFFGPVDLAHSSQNWIYANRYDSGGGSSGLQNIDSQNFIEQGAGLITSLQRQPVFRDDFFGDSLDARWNTAGTGTPTFALQSLANGVVRLTTSATTSDTAELNWNGITAIDVSDKPVLTIGFELESNNSSWTIQLKRDTSNLIKLAMLSDTAARLTSISGGTTSFANFSITGAHTDMNEYRIDVRSDKVTVYQNGQSKTTVTTNIPSGLLEPQIIVTTSEGVSHYMDLDSFDIRVQP